MAACMVIVAPIFSTREILSRGDTCKAKVQIDHRSIHRLPEPLLQTRLPCLRLHVRPHETATWNSLRACKASQKLPPAWQIVTAGTSPGFHRQGFTVTRSSWLGQRHQWKAKPVINWPVSHSHRELGNSLCKQAVSSPESAVSVAEAAEAENLLELVRKPVKMLQEGAAFVKEHWKEMLGLNYWVIRDFQELVVHVNALEPHVMAMSDAQLQGKTLEFRERLGAGETLDDIQAEAFAVVREAARRTLGMRHFDVQIIGGGVLHAGAVAEMRTGEGKTLVATLAAYLNALPGKGVHVVTVNDYLALRDAEWMGKVHRFLGLTVGCIQTGMSEREKRREYNCDITYAHNYELGWDYLRDNLEVNASARVLRWPEPFNYAIIDEIDSVLIDDGRSPLLISKMNMGEQEKLAYNRIISAYVAARLVQEDRGAEILTSESKYKTVDLTAYGVERAEKLLEQTLRQQIDFWEQDWARLIINALKAEAHYIQDRDYIIVGKEVKLLDETSGRVVNKKWSHGIQQAVEAKEYLRRSGEVSFTALQSPAAKATWQGLVRMYPKRAGMTGTGKTEEAEFLDELGMPVVVVPSNKPSRRIDHPVRLMRTKQQKWWAVLDEAYQKSKEEGRPVLIGTTSVSDSQELSEELSKVTVGWRHSVLNAKPENAAREAAIVAQAGRRGVVTIATNMAGRGTDILLGGNPEMLAREILSNRLQPYLEDYEDQKPVVSDDFQYIPLSDKAESTIKAVQHLLGHVERKVTIARANEMVQKSMDRATQMSPGQLAELEAKLAEPRAPSESSSMESEARGVSGGQNGSWKAQERELKRRVTSACGSILHDCRLVCRRESEFVRQRGGLHVIGTELQESRRIDDQLRGRAGRQGDPGSTKFIISLEDTLFTKSPAGTELLAAAMFDDGDNSSSVITAALLAFQGQVDAALQGDRRGQAQFERIQEGQRLQVYALRQHLLEAPPDAIESLMKMYIQAEVDEQVAVTCNPSLPVDRWRLTDLLEGLQDLVGVGEGDAIGREALLEGWQEERLRLALEGGDHAELARGRGDRVARPAASDHEETRWQRILASCAHLKGPYVRQYALLRKWLGNELVAYYERILEEDEHETSQRRIALDELDSMWRRHLVVMERLFSGVNLRAYAYMEPLEEYKIDTTRAFAAMLRNSFRVTVRRLLNQRIEDIPLKEVA